MRITKKRKNGLYELKVGKEIYGEAHGIRLVQVVGRYEDIEEELGVSLILYCKLMRYGFYGFCKDEDHEQPYIFHFEHKDFDLDAESKEIVIWWECSQHDDNEENIYKKFKLKDYGRTWALTEEELC